MKKFIERELEKRKQTAEKKANENLAAALLNSEFKKLYSEGISLMIEHAKHHSENKYFNLKEVEINKEKQILQLKKMNINYKDLFPNYSCKKCEDTGNNNGMECECVKKLKTGFLLKKSMLSHTPQKFENSDLSVFDKPEEMKKIYDIMKNWCDSNKPSKINIVFSGKTGTGKTFLLECILSELIKKNKYVLFTTAFSFGKSLHSYHTTFDESRDSYIREFLNADILIIDDLGSEPILKNVNEEYLYLILNQRMLENKPVIISTNLLPLEIQEKYGERIFSRLINKKHSLLIEVNNADLRLKK